MGRHREEDYYLRSIKGRAVLEFTTAADGQRKVSLGLPYDPERSSPEERRAAKEAASKKYRELTAERVVVEDARVRTSLTLNELYALYLDRWEPDEKLDENAKKRLTASLIVRRTYGATLTDWASDEALRPDGTRRWRGDGRTPLQRVVIDSGPADFLAWRLTAVVRKTMRKEKSNLVHFLEWAKANGYLATVPTVGLPQGGGVQQVKNGRGVHVPLTVLESRQIVEAMPERSPRGMLVRSFFEFMWLTGLRPATIRRIEAGRNWTPGMTVLRLADEDDKAKYGRDFPLTKMAIALLERVAPKSGHIWGHHDLRKYIARAAAIVFKDDQHRREMFGSYHLRHFLGTYLANRPGANLAAAQYLMGHTQLSTTSQYVHPDEVAARAELEAVELEFSKAAKKAAAWAKKNSSSILVAKNRRKDTVSKNSSDSE